jgi:hypothetical protein
MAARTRQRRKKTSPRRRKAKGRKTAKQSRGLKLLHPKRLGLFISVIAAGLAGLYIWGSLSLRSSMEQTAMAALNPLRTTPGMPALIRRALDATYDAIPSSVGFIVEGGELVRDEESIFLGGKPRSSRDLMLLEQGSYLNLFDPRLRQTACVALRLRWAERERAAPEQTRQVDARRPALQATAMQFGKWEARPLLPASVLAPLFGELGNAEAGLITQHLPMSAAFADGPWEAIMRALAIDYPRRFEEVWLYLGPIHARPPVRLASGVAVPVAFYAVVFDLTDAGGLRALALRVPAEAASTDWRDYLSSIEAIEAETGLRFVPELDTSAAEALRLYRPPQPW